MHGGNLCGSSRGPVCALAWLWASPATFTPRWMLRLLRSGLHVQPVDHGVELLVSTRCPVVVYEFANCCMGRRTEARRHVPPVAGASSPRSSTEAGRYSGALPEFDDDARDA